MDGSLLPLVIVRLVINQELSLLIMVTRDSWIAAFIINQDSPNLSTIRKIIKHLVVHDQPAH